MVAGVEYLFIRLLKQLSIPQKKLEDKFLGPEINVNSFIPMYVPPPPQAHYMSYPPQVNPMF